MFSNISFVVPLPVSILMPIYNKIKYLPRSIDSLKNQTFHNFEIIAIDDCSGDNSSEYIIEQMKNDSRIKLIQHIYNQGICSGRNHGVIHSIGQYILSLDPDDTFYNNTVETSLKSAIESDADVLEFRIAAKHRDYTNFNWINCFTSYQSTDYLLKKLQKFRFGSPSWNLLKKIVRRSVYLKAIMLIEPFVANKRIVLSEDMLQFNAILIFSRNFICTNYLLYTYYKDLPDQATSKGYVSRYQSSIQYKYLKNCVRYIYRYRKEPEKCNFTEFLNVTGNSILYGKVRNIDKTPRKNCMLQFDHVSRKYFNQSGYCLIVVK